MRKAHFYWAGILIVLVLAGTAPAPTPMIDDFESYWGTPPLQAVWTDTDGNPSTNTAILLTSGSNPPEGKQAMEWDYHVAGGWLQPGNATDTSTADHAMIGRTFAPLDFQAGGGFELYIRPYLQDLDKTNWYLLEYGGDGYGQTLIPTYKYNPSWWPDPYFPAIIAPPGWTPPPYLAYLPVIYAGQWGKVVIKENMYVPWGQALVDFDAMTSIGISVLSGWTDTSAAPKFSGTDTLYPAGSITGRMDVDAIYYVPEPATIALLGLGGWVIIRKKK